MFYVAIGYALALAAPEVPQLIGDSPAATAQVEMIAGAVPAGAPADIAPQAAAESVAVSDPTIEPQRDWELERAARDFRIETYQTHRLDRDTYDHHIAAGEQLYKAWQRQPGSDADRAELLAWYGQARMHTRLSQALPLPPSYLQGEGEMLASEDSDLPQIVVEFPAEREQSLLSAPPAPPAAQATPVPSLEMHQLQDAHESQPADEATVPVDPLAELDMLEWDSSDDTFDLKFDNDLQQTVRQYNGDVRDMLTYLGGDEPWTVDNLEPVALRLSDLAAQRQILALRAQLQNAEIYELASLEPCLDRFAVRLDEARGHAERLSGSYPQANLMDRVTALEAVHQRLAAGK